MIAGARRCGDRQLDCRTMRSTIRRTIGATTSTVGNATTHDEIQADIYNPGNPSTTPIARAVAIPETTSDMKPERRRPKTIGA